MTLLEGERAQATIGGFVAGAGEFGADYDEIIRVFWQWAPQQLELESLAVGQLNAWLEQALGEAGVPLNERHEGRAFDRIES